MRIPKKVIIGRKEYVFIQVCNSNMFLYEDIKTKAKTTFSRFDLGIIDNKKIDKMLNKENTTKETSIVVYDRLFEKETIYKSTNDVCISLGISHKTLLKKINNNEWLLNRWFIERVDE